VSQAQLGILGEDVSDGNTIAAIVKTLTGNHRIEYPTHNFRGSGNLLNSGSRVLRQFHEERGCTRFVICLDADTETVEERTRQAQTRIIKPTGLSPDYCIVVPVRAIEAWILADIDKAIVRWTPTARWRPAEVRSPEMILDPKRHLIRISREGGTTPRYTPSTDNPKIAKHLDLDRVEQKCPSFRVLKKFVRAKP
jgi:hypothetical protein